MARPFEDENTSRMSERKHDRKEGQVAAVAADQTSRRDLEWMLDSSGTVILQIIGWVLTLGGWWYLAHKTNAFKLNQEQKDVILECSLWCIAGVFLVSYYVRNQIEARVIASRIQSGDFHAERVYEQKRAEGTWQWGVFCVLCLVYPLWRYLSKFVWNDGFTYDDKIDAFVPALVMALGAIVLSKSTRDTEQQAQVRSLMRKPMDRSD